MILGGEIWKIIISKVLGSTFPDFQELLFWQYYNTVKYVYYLNVDPYFLFFMMIRVGIICQEFPPNVKATSKTGPMTFLLGSGLSSAIYNKLERMSYMWGFTMSLKWKNTPLPRVIWGGWQVLNQVHNVLVNFIPTNILDLLDHNVETTFSIICLIVFG